MMLIVGEMHLVTFIFAVLELLMLVFLLPGYLYRPKDRPLLWYLILLVLLIVYNVTGGLFPNPNYVLPVYIQNILAYGSGFLMASYFPFYFYKAFELKLLRWHATYGVPIFLLLPFLGLFVISYAVHKDLEFTLRWGLLVPFIYSVVLLRAILRAIRSAYKENGNKGSYFEEVAVYCAVVPWPGLAVIVYFDFGQLAEVLFANLGFLAITVVFILRTIKQGREIYKAVDRSADEVFAFIFEANCRRCELTKTETVIAWCLYQGLSNREIAEKLLNSEETIKKHVHNILVKTRSKNRTAFIRIMQTLADQ